MDAKKAREIAEAINRVDNQKDIKYIDALIEQAVKKGGFQCSCYHSISPEVIKYFEFQGYTLKYQDEGRNDFSYLITW